MLYQLIGSDAWAVGASGAIFGLLGALLTASYRQRHTRAGGAVFGQLLVLLVINLALPLFVPNIAWQAHVGGLAAGALIGAVWDRLPRTKGSTWKRVAVALGVGVACAGRGDAGGVETASPAAAAEADAGPTPTLSRCHGAQGQTASPALGRRQAVRALLSATSPAPRPRAP